MNTEEFKNRLAAGDLPQAEALLKQYIEEQIDGRAKAELVLALAEFKIKAENEINRQYLGILENMLQEMKDLEKQKGQIGDELDLQAARDKLK
jgi:DNA polymerase III delta prime subunit